VEQLHRDLEARGLNPFSASKVAGLGWTVVSDWLHRRYEPSARALKQFLESHGLPKAPYEEFLRLPYVTQVCPVCGRRRPIRRSMLRFAEARIEGRKFQCRPDGSYERLCRDCTNVSSHHLARLRRASTTALKKQFPAYAEILTSADEDKDPAARADRRELQITMAGGPERLRLKHEKFRRWVRQPRTIAVRHAISVGAIGRRYADMTKPFHLCPLCELVIVGFRWHRVCLQAWWGYVRRTLKRVPRPGERPPPSCRRQHSPERYLRRDYGWLIARRKKRQTRKDLLPESSSPTTVTKGVQAFVRRLPGSWDLVFTKRRAPNNGRQTLVPLPDELASLIEAGQRDPLIYRLAGFGMRAETIARITGASIYRVRGVIAGQSTRARESN